MFAVIEERERRRVIVVLAVSVVLMFAFWIAWYADRSLVASNTRSAYYEFENAFPLADGWLTVALIGSAWSLNRRSPITDPRTRNGEILRRSSGDQAMRR